MQLKQHIPFRIRHTFRRGFLERSRRLVGSLPQHYASGSVAPRGALLRGYQRRYWRWYLRRFFSKLLFPDALVFDVGANIGVWTRALRATGCRVIAVEPQGECTAEIAEEHEGDPDVTVVTAAIGAAAGEAELFLGASSGHASTSEAWMQSMIDQAGVAPDYWKRSIRVPVRTLDDLIEEFGVPDYVKLDVEGAEAAALRGLSRTVSLVSFETHGQTPGETRDSVARLLELGDYEFNLSPGEFPELTWPDWRGPNELLHALDAQPWGWNNVFARIPATRRTSSGLRPDEN